MSLSREELLRESKRKAFHALSLVYLGFYALFGREATLWALGGFILAEGSVEVARLRSPRLNAALMDFFGGIHRPAEAGRISGILWTSLGSWLTILLFGGQQIVVQAALLYLALGDGVAALAGKAFGRRAFTLGGRRKSLEGTLACLAACLAAGALAGVPAPALWAGAATATLVELAPLPPDDNLWLPLAAAWATHAFL